VRDRFGAELRRWRLARGLTQRGLAGLIWHSQELVAKVERQRLAGDRRGPLPAGQTAADHAAEGW
jgi:transcriptional regulator with XRE-family HTH domain